MKWNNTLWSSPAMFSICLLFVLVAQSCPTLCDSMDYSPPGSSAHGIFPGKNTGVGCHFLLQEIFPTQGLNLGLLHCRQTLYHLSHQGNPVLCLICRVPDLWSSLWHAGSLAVACQILVVAYGI